MRLIFEVFYFHCIPIKRFLTNAVYNAGGKRKEKKSLGKNPSKAKKNEQWARQSHEVWQIDGKEHIKLGNGDKVSWLQIGDEGSGSLLASRVADVLAMRHWSQAQVCAVIEDAFKKWTLPQKIKIDNGIPFVNAKARDVPTMMILWWAGLGIEVIQNTPGRPQENGIVEKLQGTIHRWVNPLLYDSAPELQEALDEVCTRQRDVFRIRHKGDKTRKELFPNLYKNSRPYSRNKFSMKRVFNYLADFIWERKVRPMGIVSLFGKDLPVGLKWKGSKVCVRFDPKLNSWIIALAEDGTQLNIVKNILIDKDKIFEAIGFD